MTPHRLVPLDDPDAELELPGGRGRARLFVCTECGMRQLDPSKAPFTEDMGREFKATWGWDARDCDEVKRAKALGLHGA